MNDSVQFDASVYQVFCAELGDEDAIEVLKVFLVDATGKFRTLAAKVDNRAEMAREAHSIKSSSATFGFMALADLAHELEAGASSLTSTQVQELVRRMAQTFGQTARFAEANMLKQGSVAA